MPDPGKKMHRSAGVGIVWNLASTKTRPLVLQTVPGTELRKAAACLRSCADASLLVVGASQPDFEASLKLAASVTLRQLLPPAWAGAPSEPALACAKSSGTASAVEARLLTMPFASALSQLPTGQSSS